MKSLFVSFLLIIQTSFLLDYTTTNKTPALSNTISIEQNIDYALWQSLLSEHVTTDGLVDYKGFLKDKDKLHHFTKQLSQNTPNKSWLDSEKKAYLINAYNAFTIQLVVDNYPVESIKDIGNIFSRFFKIEFIDYNNKLVSLDDIEKGMLLPMGDERVHFAINCASYSCPKISNKVYRPETLNKQLDEAAHHFINSKLNIISKNQAKLSKIFKWYSHDFETDSTDLINYINKYSKIEITKNANIEYLDYNWSLNSKHNPK